MLIESAPMTVKMAITVVSVFFALAIKGKFKQLSHDLKKNNNCGPFTSPVLHWSNHTNN